jgi:hypothetical protein
MTKWIWRMLDGNNEDLLWLRLLREKYNVDDLFRSNCLGGSPFWHSTHKIKELFVIMVKQHMPWDGLRRGWAKLCARGFRRGKHTNKHDRKEHKIYPGSGLS